MAKRFPILWPDGRKSRQELELLGCPKSIPWELIARHESQALRNHDQSLQRLAERGGLSPLEAVAVLTNVSWTQTIKLPIHAVVAHLIALVNSVESASSLSKNETS